MSDTANLKRTPLFAAHKALGAKLVNFGGWEMPVQYAPGIIEEHKRVRSAVGLFDVCHMGEIYFRGPRAVEAVQRLCTNAVGKLTDGQAAYNIMCYPDGGIVDDCYVYRRSANEILVIVNASNVDKDFAWMQENVGSICAPANESEAHGLIAVQGPKAAALVARLAGTPLDESVPKNHFAQVNLAGVSALACRTGYTGEDGFEICCPIGETEKLWNALLDAGKADDVLPIGLGARDTLRLEAKLSLYGNDIDQTTTPIEAGLAWVVKLDNDFIGKDALAKQKAEGPKRKLVGFVARGRGIARHDYPIWPHDWPENHGTGLAIGKVTSGTTAPSLGVAVGLGYVPVEHSPPGTRIVVDCRGKPAPFEIVAGAFYKRSK